MDQSVPSDREVELDDWDQGDVIAVVDDPKSFETNGKPWTTSDTITATFGLATGGLTAVPMVLLMLKGRRPETQPPHAALIGKSDARDLARRGLLSFPAGGPSTGQVYARHPLQRSNYLPFAGYHRMLLSEKSIEAVRFLLSLGARDIQITWRQSNGKSAKSENGISVPTAEDISLTMGFGRDDSGHLAIRISGAGKARPQVDDLVWPSRDPMFKLMRTSADAGATEFHIGLRSEQSMSVNASAAAGLREAGFSLGGEYKRYEELTFTVDAAFAGDVG